MKDLVPPQNLEAERKLLCGCLLDPDVVDEVAEFLKAEDFYRDSHEHCWRAIVDIRNSGEPVDTVSLAEHLTREGRFDSIGGDNLLEEVMNSAPHAANAVYHANIVKEKAVARRLLEASLETVAEINRNQDTCADLVSNAESRIFAITDGQSSGRTVSAVDHMDETMNEIIRRRDRRQRKETDGIYSEFDDLDDIVGGFRPGELIIVAARPSIGKTALALEILRRVAKKSMVLFFSLEMGRQAIGGRLLSAQAQINSRLIDSGYLSDGDLSKVIEAQRSLSARHYKIDDSTARSAIQIRSNSRRTKLRHGLSLIIVDYIQLIDAESRKGRSRQEEVAEISKALKATARELNVPLIALCQLNRKSEDREDRRPRMADLRESGALEQDADVVILLHRPEFYDPNDQPGVARIYVEKNRNGMTGDASLTYVKSCTRFDPLSNLEPHQADDSEPF